MSIDPHLKREQSKYDEPIASREFILDLIQSHKQKLTRKDIGVLLNINNSKSKSLSLKKRLRAMERDGQIFFTKQGYLLPENMSLISGKIISHRNGFGFLASDSLNKDLFISKNDMRFYFHGEQVEVLPDFKKRSCKILKLVEPIQNIIGVLCCNGADDYYLEPRESKIFQRIKIVEYHDFVNQVGSLVNVLINKRPVGDNLAEGLILSVLSSSSDIIEQAVFYAISDHGLVDSFTEEALEQTASFGDEITSEDEKGRVDLTHVPFVTIDGETSRDFDDAVFVDALPDGSFNLKVAIADVSHYVQQGSALDNNALEKSSSVYFPHMVIPMLPEHLSNNLCSLNPNVKRLALVCDMVISDSFKVSSKFYTAVIKSHARLTYTEATQMIEQPDAIEANHQSIIPYMQDMHKLYLKLHAASRDRGALIFNRKEIDFLINDGSVDLFFHERSFSHKMIEEFMVITNSEAAKYIKKHKIKALNRVHSIPVKDKLVALRSVLSEKGLVLAGEDDPSPSDFADFIDSIADLPDKDQLEFLLLRCMSQALYAPDAETGHFGLSLQDYSHFTSPIRRYPDLQLHRAIKAFINKEKYEISNEELEALGAHCSKVERSIDDATRDFNDFLRCLYMQDFIGKKFKATIVSVLKFGFFARINENFIDGFVPFETLKSHYESDLTKQCFVDTVTNSVYKIGHQIEIIVARADIHHRKIDFLIEEETIKTNTKKTKKNEKK